MMLSLMGCTEDTLLDEEVGHADLVFTLDDFTMVMPSDSAHVSVLSGCAVKCPIPIQLNQDDGVFEDDQEEEDEDKVDEDEVGHGADFD